jgi:hypothetical protein
MSWRLFEWFSVEEMVQSGKSYGWGEFFIVNFFIRIKLQAVSFLGNIQCSNFHVQGLLLVKGTSEII